jgi:glycosyltransferase involved in cell wall biosynthesis
MAGKEELVSVVIPTRDSAATLGLCLESLRNQTHPYIEIIVVDQQSRDETILMARKFADRIIASARPPYYASPSVERNYGARYASGAYLLHIDSDMELANSVVEECLSLSNAGYEVVVIPETDIGQGFWSECKRLERSMILRDGNVEAARFFSKHAFDCVSGYNQPAISTEDWVLHQKLVKAGFKVGKIQAQITHHLGKMTLSSQIMKKYYYGRKARGFLARDPRFALKALSPIRPGYIRDWRLLLKHPRLALGVSLLRTCELYSAFMGSLVGP